LVARRYDVACSYELIFLVFENDKK